MKTKDSERLEKIVSICTVHRQGIKEARTRLDRIFPLTAETCSSADSEMIAFIDQYLFRFAKLQSIIGEKLF